MRTRLVSTLVTGIVLAAGCGGTEPGSPTRAATTGPTSSGSTSAEPEPSTTTPDDGLASVDPCELVSTAELGPLGFTRDGQPDDVLGALSCTWAGSGRAVSVIVDAERGIDDTNTGQAKAVEEITIGDHSGRRVEEATGPGFCDIDLAVTDASSVTITGLVNDDTSQACQIAQQVATIVEPKLP